MDKKHLLVLERTIKFFMTEMDRVLGIPREKQNLEPIIPMDAHTLHYALATAIQGMDLEGQMGSNYSNQDLLPWVPEYNKYLEEAWQVFESAVSAQVQCNEEQEALNLAMKDVSKPTNERK